MLFKGDLGDAGCASEIVAGSPQTGAYLNKTDNTNSDGREAALGAVSSGRVS